MTSVSELLADVVAVLEDLHGVCVDGLQHDACHGVQQGVAIALRSGLASLDDLTAKIGTVLR